jgi:hypothetical protein
MSKSNQLDLLTLRQKMVLSALQYSGRTWDELRALTKISDERLGFTIGELLDMRKIWTGQKDGTRIYGIERRIGLVPRSGYQQRRASDMQA